MSIFSIECGCIVCEFERSNVKSINIVLIYESRFEIMPPQICKNSVCFENSFALCKVLHIHIKHELTVYGRVVERIRSN